MCTVQTVLKFSLVQSSQDNMWVTSGHALPEIQNSTCKLQTRKLQLELASSKIVACDQARIRLLATPLI